MGSESLSTGNSLVNTKGFLLDLLLGSHAIYPTGITSQSLGMRSPAGAGGGNGDPLKRAARSLVPPVPISGSPPRPQTRRPVGVVARVPEPVCWAVRVLCSGMKGERAPSQQEDITGRSES